MLVSLVRDGAVGGGASGQRPLHAAGGDADADSANVRRRDAGGGDSTPCRGRRERRGGRGDVRPGGGAGAGARRVSPRPVRLGRRQEQAENFLFLAEPKDWRASDPGLKVTMTEEAQRLPRVALRPPLRALRLAAPGGQRAAVPDDGHRETTSSTCAPARRGRYRSQDRDAADAGSVARAVGGADAV